MKAGDMVRIKAGIFRGQVARIRRIDDRHALLEWGPRFTFSIGGYHVRNLEVVEA